MYAEKEEINKLCKIKVPIQIYTYLATVSNVEVNEDYVMNVEVGYRIGLEPHANMPVVRRHAYIILDTGRVADVSTFNPDYA